MTDHEFEELRAERIEAAKLALREAKENYLRVEPSAALLVAGDYGYCTARDQLDHAERYLQLLTDLMP